MINQIKIYNEEGTLVAIDVKQALELLKLNGYKVINCNDHWFTSKKDLAKYGNCPIHNKR